MSDSTREPPTLEALEQRLRELEDARRWEGTTPILTKIGQRLRRSALRALSPPVGVLRQHAPRPLRVPARYHRTRTTDAPPVILVVTPTRDGGRFLRAAVESVLSQGYPALRYHVQDGASADDTRAVLAAFGDALTWASEPDAGQAQAINRAFARGEGEIMGWLNSDDRLLPGALAAVASFFAQHPEVDAVYGHRVVIDEDDHEIGRWVMPPHEDDALSWGDYVPQETLFWRRRLWERVGARLDESFDFALDWDLLLRFRDAGARFAVVPRFLGAFRAHPAQKTNVAMAGRGWQEIVRLRERVHGRYVPSGEAGRALDRYLDRSSIAHALSRIGWSRL